MEDTTCILHRGSVCDNSIIYKIQWGNDTIHQAMVSFLLPLRERLFEKYKTFIYLALPLQGYIRWHHLLVGYEALHEHHGSTVGEGFVRKDF